MLIEEEEEEEEEIVAKIPSCSLTCEIVDFCRVCNQNLWRRKKESKIRLRRRLKVMKTKKKDKVENDTQSYDHRVQQQQKMNQNAKSEKERRRRLFLQVANVWQMISSLVCGYRQKEVSRSRQHSPPRSINHNHYFFCNLLASVSDCVN